MLNCFKKYALQHIFNEFVVVYNEKSLVYSNSLTYFQ